MSLFDFGPTAEDVENQFRNWTGWFGHQQESRVAIWLEIDRAAAHLNLRDAGQAREEWRNGKRKRFIPGVEACHRGPVHISAVVRTLLVDQYNNDLFRLCGEKGDIVFQQLEIFEQELPPPPEDLKLVKILKAARNRAAQA